MASDKLKRLLKYKQDIEQKLSENTPPKHQHHPDTYKQYLKNELSSVNLNIEKAKGLA